MYGTCDVTVISIPPSVANCDAFLYGYTPPFEHDALYGRPQEMVGFSGARGQIVTYHYSTPDAITCKGHVREEDASDAKTDSIENNTETSDRDLRRSESYGTSVKIIRIMRCISTSNGCHVCHISRIRRRRDHPAFQSEVC